MSWPEFFISFDQCPATSTLDEIRVRLESQPKKKIADVTLGELARTDKYPNGVYLMYSGSELWYVGKCTSRSFIERIPSHFDQREEAWFSTVPKRIRSFAQEPISYAGAHAQALELNLVLIGIHQTSVAKRLETALRSYLKPKLNTANRPLLSGGETLQDVCGPLP